MLYSELELSPTCLRLFIEMPPMKSNVLFYLGQRTKERGHIYKERACTYVHTRSLVRNQGGD